MYLHIGGGVVLPHTTLIGVFDLDNMSYEKHSRDYLNAAQQAGILTTIGEDIPRSVVVSEEGVFLSPVSSRTLAKRLHSYE